MGLADAVTGDYSPPSRGRVKRFLNWLYRLTFEVGEGQFATFGYYPEDAWYNAARTEPVTVPEDKEPETDPVAYTRAHTTSPAVLALMDEVERGRQRREQGK